MQYGRDFAGKFFTLFVKHVCGFLFLWRELFFGNHELVLRLIVEPFQPGVNYCLNFVRCCIHIGSLFMFKFLKLIVYAACGSERK